MQQCHICMAVQSCSRNGVVWSDCRIFRAYIERSRRLYMLTPALHFLRRGRPRLTLANQVSLKVTWIDRMHVKYRSFHRQFFQVFTIAPRLYHLEIWLAGRHRHLSSLLKAEPFKISMTSATTG